MTKRERLEGGSMSQLSQLIGKIGYNQDVNVELGTVVAPPPALRIKIDGMKINLEADDFIVAEHLTAHTRQATINGTVSTIEFDAGLVAGDRVILMAANDNQQYYVIDKAVTY